MPDQERAVLDRFLTDEERARITKFYFQADREQRTVARGRLRQLLGSYLSIPPSEVRLRYANHGKPSLIAGQTLRFNVSHAGGWALFAFTSEVEIGVDLEPVNRGITLDGIVSHFFSPAEIPVILRQPTREKANAFFRAWTRKEALIKAHGHGLSLPLSQFGVSIEAEDPVRVLHTDWSVEEWREWELRSFTVQEDLPGAIALRGPVDEIKFYDLAS